MDYGAARTAEEMGRRQVPANLAVRPLPWLPPTLMGPAAFALVRGSATARARSVAVSRGRGAALFGGGSLQDVGQVRDRAVCNRYKMDLSWVLD